MQELHINKTTSNPDYHTIEKTIQTDNQTIYFKLLGTPFYPKSKIEQENINTLLNNIFQNKMLNFNIENIIYYIRIILKDYEENYLMVKVNNHQENQVYSLTFEEEKIKECKLTKQLKTPNSTTSHIPAEIIIEYDDKNKSISQILRESTSENHNLELGGKIYTIIANLAQSLLTSVNNIKSPSTYIKECVPTEEENEILAQAYEIIFSEVPDFSQEQTIHNFIAMFELINQCGIDLFKHNKFLKEYNNTLAVQNLPKTSSHLAPYGKLDDLVGWNTIDSQTQKELKILENKIEKFCYPNRQKEQVLQNIKVLCEYKLLSRLINDYKYLNNDYYITPFNMYPYEINNIANYLHCSKAETLSYLKLLDELSQEKLHSDIKAEHLTSIKKIKTKKK